MKKILFSLISFIFIYFHFQVYSASDVRASVQVCTGNSTTCQIVPPSQISSLPSISEIDVTIQVNKLVLGNFQSNYSGSNWGITFQNPSNSNTKINCYGSTCIDSTTNTVLFNTINVTSYPPDPGSSTNSTSGTLTVKMFNVPSGITVNSYFMNLISSGDEITVIGAYSSSTGPQVPATWKADLGALINPPKISGVARDGGFVINLSGPSDLSAVQQDVAVPPTSLTLTPTKNSLSGYVIAYWLAQTSSGGPSSCATNGNWSFAPNPYAYNNTSTPIYSCTYTPYNSAFGIGGTSSVLGCTNTGNFLTNSINLTADSAAVPNFLLGLQQLIANPAQEFASNSCLNVIYVPITQSSWGKEGINNGDVYGVVAWALNAAYPPNLSLAHSNISYITGVKFKLASTDKNPDLSLTTKDCFVVTAASGNVNSGSVFYWRILRDEYLTPMGITPYYYRHARNWSFWLDKHPALKPPLNFVFDKTGYFLYHTSVFFKSFQKKSAKFFLKLKDIFSNIIEEKASADELQTKQEDQKASADELQTKQEDQKKSTEPNYEFFMSGGILKPTADKKYYDDDYSSRPNYFIEAGSGYIFWGGNFGLSIDLLGRYLTNTKNDSILVLGSTSQQYSRTYTFLSAETFVGIRYRNPTFLYFQPQIFAGVGLTHLREYAVAHGDPGSNSSGSNQTLGISKWSPNYEVGLNLDFSILQNFDSSTAELGFWLDDILIRLSASYNINPTKTLSSTGYLFQGGFVFLIN